MIARVTLPDGTAVPALGQGTWHMGEARAEAAAEVAALRAGIDLGLSLIDTAEMYAEGGAERVVAEAIRGQRERVFLVSKVYPHNASAAGMAKACAASMKRLGTDWIDLYLLHWRGGVPLADTVAGFERLREAGHIKRWGVSNFDTDDMAELNGISANCAVNQVLYHPGARGIEFDLMPWCRRHHVPVMAYSPLGQAGKLLRSKALLEVARRHGVTSAEVALAWALRDGATIAIPKAVGLEHVRRNAAAAGLTLTDDDLAVIDGEFKPPVRKTGLAML